MTAFRRFLPLLCLLISLTAHAQVPRPGTFGEVPGRTGNPSSTTGTPNSTGGRIGGSIIDDSTKIIYGPRTTRFFLEPDVFNNRRKLYTVDTVLGEGHRYNFVQRSQNRYQDLGNLGTALRPVFYEEPQQIGAQTGYYVYAPYQFQTDRIRYFDTKSPFTRLYLALGGREQNILGFDFTQNVTPRWNLGFNLQRFTSNKQFGTPGRSDPQRYAAQNWGFVAHSNYRAKNEKYTLLAHFNHMNQEAADQGGVLRTFRPVEQDSILDYEGQARLNGANGQAGPGTREIHNDFHLYQQYVLASGFQLYDRLDVRRQINGFDDYNLLANQTANNFYYPEARYDTTRIAQDVRSLIVENYAGIKGDYKAFNYRTFLHVRNYSQTGTYNVPLDTAAGRSDVSPTYDNKGTEIYVGGWLGYYFPDSTSLATAELEYLLGGGFRLAGRIESKLFTAGYTSILAEPTLLQRRFRSNLYDWNNRGFGLRGTQHFYGLLNLKVRNIALTPGLDYSLLTNYTYFNTQAEPAQFRGVINILRTGLGYNFQAGKFGVSGQGYYTLTSQESVLRQPRLFLNTRLQYELLYAKVLYIQTGIDLHYKSAYFADAYMPVTQQFYLQNRQRVEGRVVADLFANLRVNRVRLFVKLAYFNQGILTRGYYVTPDYLSQRRSFGFGVDWYLFD